MRKFFMSLVVAGIAISSYSQEIVVEEVVVEEVVEEKEPEIPVIKETPAESPESAADRATEERHRRFLLGKTVTRKITTDSGVVLVNEGDTVTEEVLQKVKIANKFIDLSMNVQ